MEVKIKVIKVPVGSDPFVIEIDNGLSAMQENVGGGLIQIVEVDIGGAIFDLVCNEEGLLNGMEYNRTVGGHHIHGPFFLAHHDEDGNTTSVEPGDINKLVRSIPDGSVRTRV